jgi:hypothetical protein
MSRSSLSRIVPWLGSIGLMALWAGAAQAQYSGSSGPSMSSSTMPNYNFSGAGSYFGGSSTYVPFGGAMGGFIPYSSGPGGGLGVQPGMRDSGLQMPPGGMRMLGSTPSLGLIRSTTTPLTPLGIMNPGASGMGRSGITGDLIRRTPSGGTMGGMARPPVGSYPFRVPPSLLGPANSSPAMAM